jgi:hypothetical protein
VKRKSIVTSILIAGLSVVSSASALPMVKNAADFHAVNPAEQQYLVYNAAGVSNTSGSPVTVTGTIARNPQFEGNQIVSVIGYNDDVATTTACVVIAVTPHPLGSTSVLKAIPPAGVVQNFNHTWTRSVQFSTVEAGPFASIIIRCILDGNQKSRIHSVRVSP